MERPDIRELYHTHCRFKLRSGKEVFGVVWEVETTDGSELGEPTTSLYFASVRDYERLQLEPHVPVNVLDMPPEEIVHVESLAS